MADQSKLPQIPAEIWLVFYTFPDGSRPWQVKVFPSAEAASWERAQLVLGKWETRVEKFRHV